MKRALVLTIGFLVFSTVADCQHTLTGKEIYGNAKESVVEIGIGTAFSGNGFIVSSDGVIITANHVITTRESKFKEYASNIQVRVVHNGVATIYPATPIEPSVSDDQRNFDFAKLKIAATGLPHIVLGSWDEVEIGNEIIIIPSFPGYETLMLQGIVSSKVAATNDLGPKSVNTIFFQCPVRNGFSGSPIFSQKGHVIGIVFTKVFVICPALAELRGKWEATGAGGAGVFIGGTSMGGSFLEIINNLDQNLP